MIPGGPPCHWSNNKNKEEFDRGMYPAMYPERPLTAKQIREIAALKKLVLECIMMLEPDEPDPLKRLRKITGKPKAKRVYGGSKGKHDRNPLVYVLNHDEYERATEPPNVDSTESEFYYQADGSCVVRMLHDSGCTYHAVDER